ncbi:hypothetical protein APR12_005490 [Nocardia amikacinitolerans]|uniref:hypothetical protein n=1 Tax=Nocardia amikacinitolerans TaxID=756689 RepID=UPI000A6CAA7D|nr:hypothetical protein [Nocardia amikacinitolerans]MCP2320109.1 hypothetical protein [Nocardia amikacinitolerans]
MSTNTWPAPAEQSESPSSSDDAVPLLDPGKLIQAITGRVSGGSALVGWARELGDLHAELVAIQFGRASRSGYVDGDRIHAEIDRTVDEINAWAARHVRRVKCARKHTHSLGEVISHMARTYAEAWWTVLHTSDVALWHEVWSQLGEVRQGYADMVVEIRARHLQLPLGARAIRKRGIE